MSLLTRFREKLQCVKSDLQQHLQTMLNTPAKRREDKTLLDDGRECLTKLICVL